VIVVRLWPLVALAACRDTPAEPAKDVTATKQSAAGTPTATRTPPAAGMPTATGTPPAASTPTASCPTGPRALAPGLTAERWAMRAKPIAGEACIDVVRVDLAKYRLRALSRGDGDPARTAPGWRDAFHLAAVINAGMFHASGAPVGLIVANGAVHGADNAKMGGFVAWDPGGGGDPPIAVTGRSCAGFDLAKLRARYRSIVQSYRLLDCDGKAMAWSDPKQYSAVAIGVDRGGRVALVHVRGAVTMAELSRELAAHDLAGALFLEGGPEASLVAGALARLGSYETGFIDNDDNQRWWDLPNVIGVEPR